jgi:hypothetical protein
MTNKENIFGIYTSIEISLGKGVKICSLGKGVKICSLEIPRNQVLLETLLGRNTKPTSLK